MPFDDTPEDDGHGDGSHDGLGTFAQTISSLVTGVAGDEGLCSVCARITVANLILAETLVDLDGEPSQIAEFIEDFVNKAMDVASDISSANEPPIH